ncbi:unnamed protein product [Acanthoscelides obtectus]|uniref:DDE-1 domain-containing protein n=1 Tax=Acanthoscelides obtectus TaxID=200917 RepID=A0A9P0L9S5_ACAOB|nr:unnamed protein product [Acanthoscelides obtectus]CAK1649563.1 hypothetical protein AOBTE_LOCUS16311 [Acanthoscelides obtectus]
MPRSKVSAMSSAERGSLLVVTLALAGNAIGNCIPPMLIFPGKLLTTTLVVMVQVGPLQQPMQEDDFYFFKNHVRSSKENPVLLLLYSHALHIAVKTINFCKENGIVLLTFPPHCTHRLQPMDRAIFGTVKKKPLTQHAITGCVHTQEKKHPAPATRPSSADTSLEMNALKFAHTTVQQLPYRWTNLQQLSSDARDASTRRRSSGVRLNGGASRELTSSVQVYVRL